MLFFITPTNRTDVYNIISFLNRGKSDGPNSIPTKTLKLLNKGKSDQIRFLFNQYFFFRLFPPILKTNKIIPISKGSKLDFSKYRPISSLFNIDSVLQRLMYNRLYSFLENKELV